MPWETIRRPSDFEVPPNLIDDAETRAALTGARQRRSSTGCLAALT